MTSFGIDRLLADPALRGRSRASASRCSPIPHRSPRSDALPRRARRARAETNAPRSARSTACAATSRTTWSSRRTFTDPVARHSGVQPVRRSAPADGGNDGHFDVLLVDLQDVGCRIYTFITTLRYVLEAAAEHGKSVWVLDRPNPAGRPIEGLPLRAGLGKLRRRGPAADAPRPDARRARRAGSSTTSSSTSTTA